MYQKGKPSHSNYPKNAGVYYSPGSVAHDNVLPEYQTRTPKTGPPNRKKKVAQIHTFSWLYTIKVFMLFGMVFIGCMVIMSAHALLSKERIELQKHRDQLAEIKNENTILAADISQQIDLEVIRQKAQTQLGMSPPQDYQTVYIAVPKQSYTIQYAAKEAEPKKEEASRGILGFLKRN